jgi:1-phosphatidylinositol phosphodiesterase
MRHSSSESSRSSRFASLALLSLVSLVVAGAIAAGCNGSAPSTSGGDGGSPADGGAPTHDASTATDAAPADAAPEDATLDAPTATDAGADQAASDSGAGDSSASDSSASDSSAADSSLADGGFTPANWMGAIPGSTSIADLSIPGTHDTGATVPNSPAATTQCQNLSVADQLAIGDRYFDIRVVNVSNSFEVYHLAVDQNLSFDDVLQSVYAFFDANPTETLVMCLKQEDNPVGSTNTFEQTFDSYVAAQPDRWYLGATIPTLDQARGKIVLLRRFGTDPTDAAPTPEGIDATAWADNTTFTIANASATLRIQDYYQITDDPSKWAAITSLLTEASQGDAGTLYVNNTSAYFELDSGLEDITGVSGVINPDLSTYFATNTSGRFGIVGMDFVDAQKSSLILGTNFK